MKAALNPGNSSTTDFSPEPEDNTLSVSTSTFTDDFVEVDLSVLFYPKQPPEPPF